MRRNFGGPSLPPPPPPAPPPPVDDPTRTAELLSIRRKRRTGRDDLVIDPATQVPNPTTGLTIDPTGGY